MSLRILIRFSALALGLFLFAPLLWPLTGPWPLLAGPGLAFLIVAYLALGAGRRKTSRWQLRYQMDRSQANERLDATLRFLSERAGHIVLEASSQGLFLETPIAFDRYVQIQLDRALPQARLSRVEGDSNNPASPGTDSGMVEGEVYLSLDPTAGDPLRWAAAEDGRAIRFHLHRGAYTTLTLRTSNGARPPGKAVHLPHHRALTPRFWRRLPVWDESSTGIQISRLLPPTGDDSVYSSRPRLQRLAPPQGFQAASDRPLGQTTDGHPLGLDHDVSLFTAGAPFHFLARQALDDLARGQSVIVVSPHRRVLNQIRRDAFGPVYWLDPENARASVHLAVAGAAEWQHHDVNTIVEHTQDFLAALGLNLHLPGIRSTVQHLIRILAASAYLTGHDFAFTDLYAISQNPLALNAFLADLQDMELDPETRSSVAVLAEQLAHSAGYLQLVTVLSTIRTVLSSLRTGALHLLCQPPFLDANQTLRRPGLLLAPMTNADFPEYDRFLAALLDLTLHRVLAAYHPDGAPLALALHLHDPQRYSRDAGRPWIEAARRDRRLSLLVDVQEPTTYLQIVAADNQAAKVVFRSSQALASTLIADWDLPYTVAEVAELPAGAALARLPGLPGPVMLHADNAEPRDPRP